MERRLFNRKAAILDYAFWYFDDPYTKTRPRCWEMSLLMVVGNSPVRFSADFFSKCKSNFISINIRWKPIAFQSQHYMDLLFDICTCEHLISSNFKEILSWEFVEARATHMDISPAQSNSNMCNCEYAHRMVCTCVILLQEARSFVLYYHHDIALNLQEQAGGA